MPYVVERIVAQGKEANRDRWFIPTSYQSKLLIVGNGLNLGDSDVFPTIDVAIDGADEVDSALNLIKGGGACHLQEKVIANAAKELIIVADNRKRSHVLGTSWTQGVPVEVAPVAASQVIASLKRLGSPDAKLRMGKAKAGPIITDNGYAYTTDRNFCIDAPFSPAYMRDPVLLNSQIKQLVGVVEVGIFAGMAKAAYFGNEDGTVCVQRADGSVTENLTVE